MHRTTPGLRADPATRLADLERQRPEWRSWLRLLEEARCALDDSGWETSLAVAELAGATAASPAEAPLLHGRVLEIDAARSQRLVRRLASAAATGSGESTASLRGYRPSAAAAVELLGSAVRQDRAGIAALEAAAGVRAGALVPIADLAALPLLQWCGRVLAGRVPRSWPHGYCPICAGRPILAEQRGLDRTRWLRCGRCGGDWRVEWLSCIYCGERAHERLGSLVLEDGGERLKVETCATCHGYLKSVATLQQIPFFELLLQDLETVELDLVALDRGYGRPEEIGFCLDVQVVDRASRPVGRGPRGG